MHIGGRYAIVIEIGPILQDFTIIMIAASIMAMVSYKLKQPMVIGCIIAGMIIGPFTPPFSLISNFDVLNLFAEIGVILLLFVVGMEFPIEKLRKIGKKALVIAFSEGLGKTAFGLTSSGGELALVVAKGGADVGTTSSFVLPMVGTMTIITTFITPYLIKIGWKLVDIRQRSDGKFSFGLKRSKK